MEQKEGWMEHGWMNEILISLLAYILYVRGRTVGV